MPPIEFAPWQEPGLTERQWRQSIAGIPGDELPGRIAQWEARLADWWWPYMQRHGAVDPVPLWATALPSVRRTESCVALALKTAEQSKSGVAPLLASMAGDPVLTGCPVVRSALRQWVLPPLTTLEGLRRHTGLRDQVRNTESTRGALLAQWPVPLFTTDELLNVPLPDLAPPATGRPLTRRQVGLMVTNAMAERARVSTRGPRLLLAISNARCEADLLEIFDFLADTVDHPVMPTDEHGLPLDVDGAIQLWVTRPLVTHEHAGAALVDRVLRHPVLGLHASAVLTLRHDVATDATLSAQLMGVVTPTEELEHEGDYEDRAHVLQHLARHAPEPVRAEAFRRILALPVVDAVRALEQFSEIDPAFLASAMRPVWGTARRVLRADRGDTNQYGLPEPRGMMSICASLFPHLTETEQLQVVRDVVKSSGNLETVTEWLLRDIESGLGLPYLSELAGLIAAERNAAVRSAVIMRIGTATDASTPAPHKPPTRARR